MPSPADSARTHRPMSRSVAWATSTAGLLASWLTLGCSFLLDFEELQSQTGALDAGPGGGDDTTGSDDDMDDDSASGDGDAGADCAMPCDDGDPCTTDICRAGQCVNEEKQCSSTDVCVTAECVDGECREMPIAGVVADGYSQVTEADRIYTNQLTGAGDRFFMATYGMFSGANDVIVQSFGAQGEEPLAETRFSRVIDAQDVSMRSPVSLLADTRLSLELNAYAAIQFGQSQFGELIRLQFDRDLGVLMDHPPIIARPGNFRLISDRLGPSASQMVAGDTFVVWAGANQSQNGIFLQQGDDVADTADPAFPTVADVVGLQAVTAGNRPGAVWLTNRMDGVSLQAAIVGGAVPATLTQCDTTQGFEAYQLDVDQSISDIWTVSWSERSGDDFISELTAIACSQDGCVDLTSTGAGQQCTAEQVEGRVFPDVRSLLTRTMRRQGDPDNVIYQALLVAAQDSNSDQAGLSLLLNRTEFDLANDMSSEQRALGEAVSLEVTDVARAPRWPALKILPPDKLAVSWVQPKGDGTGDELVVQRHRICFPD